MGLGFSDGTKNTPQKNITQQQMRHFLRALHLTIFSEVWIWILLGADLKDSQGVGSQDISQEFISWVMTHDLVYTYHIFFKFGCVLLLSILEICSRAKKNNVELGQSMFVRVWVVVSTHLKRISQIRSFPQVGMKINDI